MAALPVFLGPELIANLKELPILEIEVCARGKKTTIKITGDINYEELANNLKRNGYLSKGRIVILVHGFRSSMSEEWMQKARDNMLKQQDQTVILVTWNTPQINYLLAVEYVETVAKWLAFGIEHINKCLERKAKIWGVGHSLGAHILGIAGRSAGKPFYRITGLDPAGPSWERSNESKRLQKTDATEMVDVIHTDGYFSRFGSFPKFFEAAVSPVNHYGTLIPLGTIDFYPNFGKEQPCAGYTEIAGSHSAATSYFTWSILNPGKFKTNMLLKKTPEFENIHEETIKVQGFAQMGYFAEERNNLNAGNFYVKVNSSEPWD